MVVNVKNSNIESSKINLLMVAYEFSAYKQNINQFHNHKLYRKDENSPHRTINVISQVAAFEKFNCFDV